MSLSRGEEKNARAESEDVAAAGSNRVPDLKQMCGYWLFAGCRFASAFIHVHFVCGYFTATAWSMLYWTSAVWKLQFPKLFCCRIFFSRGFRKKKPTISTSTNPRPPVIQLPEKVSLWSARSCKWIFIVHSSLVLREQRRSNHNKRRGIKI
jgi:hypothetical protein